MWNKTTNNHTTMKMRNMIVGCCTLLAAMNVACTADMEQEAWDSTPDEVSVRLATRTDAGTDMTVWQDATKLCVHDNEKEQSCEFIYGDGRWTLTGASMKWPEPPTMNLTAYIVKEGAEAAKVTLPLTAETTLDQSTEEKLAACDYLYYINSEAKPANDGSIDGLSLKHVMAQVQIKVQLAAGIESAIDKIEMKLQSPKSMSYSEGAWKSAAEPVTLLPLAGSYNAEEKSQLFTAYVVPTTDGATGNPADWQCKLELTAGNLKFEAETKGIKLEGGKCYKLPLNLLKDRLVWASEGVTVTKWNSTAENLTGTHDTMNAWDGTTISESLEGEGTEENPYLVGNGADFRCMVKMVNNATNDNKNHTAYYQLTADINLGNLAMPMMTYNTSGVNITLDGNGHTVYNLNGEGQALIETGIPTIRHLTLKGTNIPFLDKYDASRGNSSFIDCHVRKSKIKNSTNAGALVNTSTSKGNGVLKMIACSVTHSSIKGTHAGCLIGTISAHGADLVGCYAVSNTIVVTATSYNVGGLVGKSDVRLDDKGMSFTACYEKDITFSKENNDFSVNTEGQLLGFFTSNTINNSLILSFVESYCTKNNIVNRFKYTNNTTLKFDYNSNKETDSDDTTTRLKVLNQKCVVTDWSTEDGTTKIGLMNSALNEALESESITEKYKYVFSPYTKAPEITRLVDSAE